MNNQDNKADDNSFCQESKMHDLTDKDFYKGAYDYFQYHAGQRTTMINFYILFFSAGVAIYGTMIEKRLYWICLAISIFTMLITWLFIAIDRRNRFDVKQSQYVLEQFERHYKIDKPLLNDISSLGVFSNENHWFDYYNRKKRKKIEGYIELKKKYKNAKKYVECKSEYDRMLKAIMIENASISREEIEKCLEGKKIKEFPKINKYRKIKKIYNKIKKYSAVKIEYDMALDQISKNTNLVSKDEIEQSLDDMRIMKLSNAILYIYRICFVVAAIALLGAIILLIVKLITNRI